MMFDDNFRNMTFVLNNIGLEYEFEDSKRVYFKLLKDMEYLFTEIRLMKTTRTFENGSIAGRVSEEIRIYNNKVNYAVPDNQHKYITVIDNHIYTEDVNHLDLVFNERLNYLIDVKRRVIEPKYVQFHLNHTVLGNSFIKQFDCNDLNKESYFLFDNINKLVPTLA